MKMTWRDLKKFDACSEQVEKFRELLPKGLDLTTFDFARLKNLQAAGLQVGWMVNQFMDAKMDDKYVQPFRGIKDGVWQAIDMTWHMDPDDSNDALRSRMYHNLGDAINEIRDYVTWKVVFRKLSQKLTRSKAAKAKKGKR